MAELLPEDKQLDLAIAEQKGAEPAAAPNEGGAAAPAAVDQPKDAPAPADNRVPVQEHIQTRQRARAAEEQAQKAAQEAAEARKQAADATAKLQQLLDRLNPAPDPASDPLGAITHKIDQTKASVEKTATDLRQMLEQANKQSAATNLQSTIANLEQQFGAKNPDYAEAVAFLKDRRMAMYAAMGLDEAAQAKTYQDEAAWLVTNALKSGKNPAEAAYEMAKLTGFAGKSAPNGQNGAAQAANPAPQAKTPAEKQLDAVREGLSNASLSNSGGVKSSEMPIEAILAMNERDFGDYLDKLTSAQWEKLARSVEKAAKA